jgi:hypothetical protein
MGNCVKNQEYVDDQKVKDLRIAALESLVSELETELTSTVSNLERKFASFKTSMAISHNMRDKRVTHLSERITAIEK